jgi:adenylate cyclase
LLGVTSDPPVQVPAGDIRIGARVEVDMPLSFQLVEGKSVLPDKVFGRIVDISYGGMYIQSQTELPLFCDVKMMLSLSLLVQEHADVYGKVLRMTAVDDGFEYRIEFTSIDVQAQTALKEFVDRLVEIK